jgi:uncharacterized glyoxalase superfamily protein PhnB
VRVNDRELARLGKGATILKPLARTAWGTKDFYLEDPDGHVIGFGELLRADRNERA